MKKILATVLLAGTILSAPVYAQSQLPSVQWGTSTGGTGNSGNIPGAAGDGITNDTAAVQNYLNTFTHGGFVYISPSKKYHVGNLSIPANVVIDCQTSPGMQLDSISAFQNLGGFRVDSSATITPYAGGGMQNCPVLRYGSAFPVQNAASFAGTAITYPAVEQDDTWFRNNLFVGFNKCIDSSTGPHSRKRWSHLECDGINGYVIGPSNDTDEIDDIRSWPWATAYYQGGTPTNARTGTGFLFSSTGGRQDDLKGNNWTDFNHAIGMDIENAGSCCNIHLDNIWLDNNTTTGLIVKGSNVSFGKLWVWNATGPGIIINGNGLLTKISQLFVSGATDCVQLLNQASIQWGTADFGSCSGYVVNASSSVSSRIKGGDTTIYPGSTTPYFNMASSPSVGSNAVDVNANVVGGSIANLLGTTSIFPNKTIGDEATIVAGISSPTLIIGGYNQTTAALSQTGALGGSILLKDGNVGAGSGGSLLFGANIGHQRHFAAIKGLLVDGSTNTSGDIRVALRASTADAALTPTFEFNHTGYVQLLVPMNSAQAVSFCTTDTEGFLMKVIDSNTSTWGATIGGGGANHVLAYCDGTNPTVMGK